MKVKFRDWGCIVKRSKYVDNNNLALVLFDEVTDEPVATATVNTGDKLTGAVAYVKDYSENTGMLKALEDAGLVKDILGTRPLGYTEVTLVEFDLSGVEEL